MIFFSLSLDVTPDRLLCNEKHRPCILHHHAEDSEVSKRDEEPSYEDFRDFLWTSLVFSNSTKQNKNKFLSTHRENISK